MKAAMHKQETELQGCREQMLQTIGTFQVSDSYILNELVVIRDSLCNLISLLSEVANFDRTWHQVHSAMIKKDLARRMRVTLKPEEKLDLIQTEVMEHDIFYIVCKILLMPTFAGLPDDQRFLWTRTLEQMKEIEPIKGMHSTIG